MKHLKTFLVLALIVVANSVSAQSTFDKWPAIKEFHGVMSETFHPAEEGNLAPIKARSEEMMNKAALLLKSDIPTEFKTKAILASAERLQLKSKALHELVTSKGADAAIVKSITELHDVFHEIVGLCSETK
jgi:hypothetical protein